WRKPSAPRPTCGRRPQGCGRCSSPPWRTGSWRRRTGGEGHPMSSEGVYTLLRGLHILAVIAWMAGLLYLPRLFAYHTAAQPGSEMDLTFQTMEAKLLRIIMNPAFVLAFIFGLGLIWVDGQVRGWRFLGEPWMVVKL